MVSYFNLRVAVGNRELGLETATLPHCLGRLLAVLNSSRKKVRIQ